MRLMAGVATSVATLTQERHPKAARLALRLEYRYGESNPRFRTENWLWETVWDRTDTASLA